MSVKKLLILSAAGLATTAMASAAFAGGPDHGSSAGFYLGANAGYARVEYEPVLVGTTTNLTDHPYGGMTAGLNLGYQFNNTWSAEYGWSYLPTARGVINSIQTSQVKSWAMYVAGKATVAMPFVHNTDFFMKAGLGLRRLKFSTKTAGTNDASAKRWSPVFGLGGSHAFHQNLRLTTSYMYYPGGAFIENPKDNGFFSSHDNHYPSANVFTVGLEYKFADMF